MRLVIGIVLLLALAVLGYFIFRTYQEKRKLAQTVRISLLIGLLIVLFYLLVLFARSRTVCLFAYSVYFLATDWLLYYLFRFSMEYIGNRFEDYVKKNLMILLLTADSIFILLNNIFGQLFDVKLTEQFGESYYVIETGPLFYIHYGIVLMLVSFCLISLIYRTIMSPVFYRRKYLTIAVILAALVVLNIFTYKSAIDYSVIGYVVEGICIYYCAFVYTPQSLQSKTLLQVAENMSVALFVLDIDGRMLYRNEYATQLLKAKEPLQNGEGTKLEDWCRSRYMDGADDFTSDETFYQGKTELFLKIELQKMKDSKKYTQGGYFIIQDCTEEMNKLRREQYLATHDSLTGLYNKGYFNEQVEKYMKSHPTEKLLLVCTDIREFKMINDFCGAKAGDEVLKNFAQMLREDMKDACVYGRLGGDIFGLLLTERYFEETLSTREKQEAFSSCMNRDVYFPIVNYIGVYRITERELPVPVMCDRARMAIATVKGDYHRRLAYYDKKLRDNMLYEQELIGELPQAIKEEQLQMYLQPQMTSEGEMLGAEALIRWVHPKKGMIMPGDFIPLFEKNGLISDVDKYIWECACKQLRKWKDEGRRGLYISVNISPRDFYFLDIYEIVTGLVRKYDIEPGSLKLEITETAMVIDLKRQMELISRLRKAGFLIEMDDFGSGYSSLNMLKEIHVDILKIDMEFLRKAEDEERSRKILQMIIGLSRQLGMPVVTEGVETAEQIAFLTKMGCDIFQGYYFAKPLSIGEFEQKYLK